MVRCLRICVAYAAEPSVRTTLLTHGVLPVLLCIARELAADGGSETVLVLEGACEVLSGLSESVEAFVASASFVPGGASNKRLVADLLVQLLGSPSRAAEHAARCIRALATHDEMCDSLVAAGAVAALVNAFEGRHEAGLRELQARCLANIAGHARHKDAIVDAGGVLALVALLELGEHPTLEAALRALGDLVNAPRMLEAFVNAHGVARLLPIMAPGFQGGTTVRLLAGWILVSLCGNPDHCHWVVSGGAVGAVVTYAREGGEMHQEEGAWALLCLSQVAANIPRICETDALQLLLLLTGSPEPHVVGQAAWALANLAISHEAKAQLHALSAVSTLVDRLEDLTAAHDPGDGGPAAEAMQQIVRCIANLLFRADCRQALAARNGAPVIVASAAATPGNDGLSAAVARSLANFSFDHAAQVVHAGGLPLLIAMLSSGSNQLEYDALGAVLNISATTMHTEALIEHGVLGPLTAIQNRDDNTTLQEQAVLTLANIAHHDTTLQDSHASLPNVESA